MIEHLVFQLHGTMASWGAPAVGEYRPSFDHPTKSAVLGLVGASLGLRREQSQLQRELAESYGFAVRVDRPGVMLEDFHTAQVPGKKADSPWWTRKEELSEPDEAINTIVSRREYRYDALYHIALWPRRDDPPFDPEEIAEALAAPTFHVYLGRKACVPSLPFDPQVVEAETLADAFAEVVPAAITGPLFEGSDRQASADIYWEEHPQSGLEPDQSVSRRDDPVHSERRVFHERSENHARITVEPPREAHDVH